MGQIETAIYISSLLMPHFKMRIVQLCSRQLSWHLTASFMSFGSLSLWTTAILNISQIRRENSGYKPVSDWLKGNKYRFTDTSGPIKLNGPPIKFVGGPIKLVVDRYYYRYTGIIYRSTDNFYRWTGIGAFDPFGTP